MRPHNNLCTFISKFSSSSAKRGREHVFHVYNFKFIIASRAYVNSLVFLLLLLACLLIICYFIYTVNLYFEIKIDKSYSEQQKIWTRATKNDAKRVGEREHLKKKTHIYIGTNTHTCAVRKRTHRPQSPCYFIRQSKFEINFRLTSLATHSIWIVWGN